MTDLSKYSIETNQHISSQRRKRIDKAWRYRALKRLPELSRRVFALRSTGYLGCGFHYSLETQLGICIINLNDPERYCKDLGTMFAQISIEGIFRSIVKAEKSLVYNE